MRLVTAFTDSKVELHSRKEIPVPLSWGADKDGNATAKPEDIITGGGLLPLGGIEESSK